MLCRLQSYGPSERAIGGRAPGKLVVRLAGWQMERSIWHQQSRPEIFARSEREREREREIGARQAAISLIAAANLGEHEEDAG